MTNAWDTGYVSSVGSPEIESEDTGAPIPEPLSTTTTPSYVPILVIVAVGAVLFYVLTALGDISAPADEAAAPETTVAPPTTNTSSTVAPEIADLPDRAPVNLLGLGGGVHIAVDEFGDAPIVSDPTGFVRIAPIESGREVMFSPTGAVWNGEESQSLPQFENGMPIDGIGVSPSYGREVVVFRSADGVVVSLSAEQTITIPTLPESDLFDLVVGDDVAYLTLEEPTIDRNVSRYSVLRVTYGDEFDVRGVDLTAELGEGFDLLRNGTILLDGTILAIATDAEGTMAKLVEFTADSVLDVEVEETRPGMLERTAQLLARGNDVFIVDRDALVFLKEPDDGFFSGSTAPVHPILSASRDGILVSIELLTDTTVVRAWLPGEEAPLEIELNGRIEPLEVVSLNSTEVLLRTTTFEDESWLINVPFPTE